RTLDLMPIHQPEPHGQVRTKIVATVGPASNTPERLRDLMEAGVDVFRLNFSHGTQDDHSRSLTAIRSVADAAGRNVGVLQDLGGPKLRLGPIPGDAIECRLGDEFTLVFDRSSDDPHQLTCSYRGLVDDLTVGDVVLFADGTVAMGVMGVESGQARLVVTLGGQLRSRQGINLPNAELKLDALTERDLTDLDWTATHGVEYVGLSFVRKAADVEQLRDELRKRNCRSRIVAKIEKPQAVDDLDAIIGASDAVMVARGDLGVELDVARVPAIQKRIIAVCHRARVPVITATQMLNSMESSSRPIRAEATDVFNAVLDGTDAVMLSGETAVGRYPVESVETMSRIVREAEAYLAEGGAEVYPRAHLEAGHAAGHVPDTTEAIVEAASLACRRLGAKLLVVASHSGRTALAVAKSRNTTPTIALAPDAATARAMSLYWGVTPLVAPSEMDDVEHTLTFAIAWARARDLIAPGDRLVWLRGFLPDDPTHNGMRVQVVT
ncbi:MAG TPA: pyruvate kinase, partial [Isosphaeraceae bacterium]